MALSGWGLTPGTLEKNIIRSLGGKYGAVGDRPTVVSDIVRQKYASGLEAKKAKETFDLAKTKEATRESEATRAFGLETEQFGFTQERELTRAAEEKRRYGLETQKFGLEGEKLALTREDAERGWADALRSYQLASMKVTGDWEQQELDRKLEDERLRLENIWRTASTGVQQQAVSEQRRAALYGEAATRESDRLAREQAGRDQLAAQRAAYDKTMADIAATQRAKYNSTSRQTSGRYIIGPSGAIQHAPPPIGRS